MSKNITLKINNAKETVETVNLQTASGEALRIPARGEVNYQFIDDATQLGPENIMTKRVGNDLAIAFEGSDIQNPDMVLEGYYSDATGASQSSLLMGQHENGGMYPYVPESAAPADAVTMLAEEVEAGQALGGEVIEALWAPAPWWLLGLLPLAALAASGGGSGGSDPAPVAPIEITVNAPDNTNDNTPAITGTTDAATGSVVTVLLTDSEGNTQTVSTVVSEDGTYTVEPETALADGEYTAEATVTDPSGATATATDPGSIDTTAVITVDAPDLTNDNTPTITGTTDDVEAGQLVTVVVTDSEGNTQTLTATVQEDGSYAVDVPVALPDGDYTATATVEDVLGNKATATDPGSVDTVAPVITIDAPDNTNDITPTITGTTDAPEGSVVTIVVTDSEGNTQTVTTTVDSDGQYSVDVPEALPEGNYTVDASVKDPAGNEGKATDTGSVDTTAPVITVDAPDDSNDATPTITGTTDAPEGSVVTIVVTDSEGNTQTVTTTVDSDGQYSVDVPEALPEGNYTVDASVKDPAGNEGKATDNGSIDTVAPTITVDAPDNTTDNTPLITGTTDAPTGSVVTVVVTDSEGNTQTLSTTVDETGYYAVEPATPLPDGEYTADASVKDPAGNEGTASDPGSIDTTVTITVDAPDLTNDNTPTITGTTDAEPGQTVSVLITDAQGNTQTVTTTVQEDGTYSVDAETPLADGEYTAEATVTDNAGNEATATDPGTVDTTAPVITVDAPDNSSDTTPTITGTTDAPEGSVVTIVVTDSEGNTQTLTATVDADGNYSVDVETPLAEGDYTAEATVADEAGNTATATDDGSIDTTAPVITVDAPDNSSDTTPTI
ncbi:MAG: Ig-like domain-containing protein, partial [Neisseria sp.]|nr:Ig-like domain-containing protein [Neisseria sp.]